MVTPVFAISPRFQSGKLSPGTLDDKIDVFEDQMQGWLFDQANLLKSSQHAGFAILAIVLSYFEPIGQFLEGRVGGSQDQFSRGLAAVFPTIDPIAHRVVYRELYNQLRCGMFHRGITKSKVTITLGGPNAIEVGYTMPAGTVDSIRVVPIRLLEESEQHLKRYTSMLREAASVQLRINFEAWFDIRSA